MTAVTLTRAQLVKKLIDLRVAVADNPAALFRSKLETGQLLLAVEPFGRPAVMRQAGYPDRARRTWEVWAQVAEAWPRIGPAMEASGRLSFKRALDLIQEPKPKPIVESFTFEFKHACAVDAAMLVRILKNLGGSSVELTVRVTRQPEPAVETREPAQGDLLAA